MMNRNLFRVALLVLGIALPAAPSHAQLSLGTKAEARALRLLKAADQLERMGEYQKAAPAYDHIIKLDDPLGEFPDIRAMAGMRLSVIFLRTDNRQNAKNVLQAVLGIAGVSHELTESIKRTLATM